MNSKEVVNAKKFVSYMTGCSALFVLLIAVILGQVLGGKGLSGALTSKYIISVILGLMSLAITYVSIKLTFKKYILPKEEANKVILEYGLVLFGVFNYILSFKHLTDKLKNHIESDLPVILSNLGISILVILLTRVIILKNVDKENNKISNLNTNSYQN